MSIAQMSAQLYNECITTRKGLQPEAKPKPEKNSILEYANDPILLAKSKDKFKHLLGK